MTPGGICLAADWLSLLLPRLSCSFLRLCPPWSVSPAAYGVVGYHSRSPDSIGGCAGCVIRTTASIGSRRYRRGARSGHSLRDLHQPGVPMRANSPAHFSPARPATICRCEFALHVIRATFLCSPSCMAAFVQGSCLGSVATEEPFLRSVQHSPRSMGPCPSGHAGVLAP